MISKEQPKNSSATSPMSTIPPEEVEKSWAEK
jgi:hypothetical protein